MYNIFVVLLFAIYHIKVLKLKLPESVSIDGRQNGTVIATVPFVHIHTYIHTYFSYISPKWSARPLVDHVWAWIKCVA